MLPRKGTFWRLSRAAALAAAAGMALTTVEPSLALAGPASSGQDSLVTAASSGATDFSAARRRTAQRRYRYRGNGGAQAAAAAAGIIGLGLGIAAAQNRRAYYDDYYGGGPYYYGPGPYYGRGYYYGSPW